MKLEGSLDAFSLPEILQLLTMTKKSGGLHLVRGTQHGVVRLADGEVTGASSDTSRQSLVRRLVGGGHLTDAALVAGVERVRADPRAALTRAIADAGEVDGAVLLNAAREHTVDAFFDVLRWNDGDFTFFVAEADPDDIGLRLTADELIAAAGQRIDEWPAISGQISSPDVVLCLTPAPAHDPTLTRDEWALVALIDGRRTVGDLVALCGRGEFAVVAVLSPLLERGLLMAPGDGMGDVAAALVRRQQLIATLELPAPGMQTPAVQVPAVQVPAVQVPALDVPALRTPALQMPILAPPVEAPRVAPLAVVAALAPEPAEPEPAVPTPAIALQPAARPPIERDEGVNRSMVLRLIAGVQEL